MGLSEGGMADLPRSAAVDAGIMRRHDLDAVRAFAMFLGIALHAALTFVPLGWIVQDSRQSELYGLFLAVVHGFRMPLFFLVSGFFTAMIWRRRGLNALLKQRTLRILLPLVLSTVTIIPAMNWVSAWAMSSARTKSGDDGTLVGAIRAGDLAAMRQRLDTGASVDEPDPKLKTTPLAWAAIRGDVEAVRLLLDRGADLGARNGDGSTPLHSAAFLGRADVVELLLERGADAGAQAQGGATAVESTQLGWDVTRMVAGMLSIDSGTEEEVEKGRAKVREILTARAAGVRSAASAAQAAKAGFGDGVAKAYQRMLDSDWLNVKTAGGTFHLVYTPVFHHLWFLWFLCWIVPVFALLAWLADRFGLPAVPGWLMNSPARFAWLIPLTMIPQLVMGVSGAAIGPDTSAGIVPMPHLLLYYGIFFGFGALYFDAKDDGGQLGRKWSVLLPVALFLAFPIGLGAMGNRLVSGLAQVTYAWAMCFAVIGLFRRVMTRSHATIRYISDSSYWLYLTHLPLIIGAQVIVRDWAWPSFVKFVLIGTTVVGILLICYEGFVRYTWIGALLNGPRKRTGIASRKDRSQFAPIEAIGPVGAPAE